MTFADLRGLRTTGDGNDFGHGVLPLFVGVAGRSFAARVLCATLCFEPEPFTLGLALGEQQLRATVLGDRAVDQTSRDDQGQQDRGDGAHCYFLSPSSSTARKRFLGHFDAAGPASSASCPSSGSRAACACARCRRRSTCSSRPCGTPWTVSRAMIWAPIAAWIGTSVLLARDLLAQLLGELAADLVGLVFVHDHAERVDGVAGEQALSSFARFARAQPDQLVVERTRSPSCASSAGRRNPGRSPTAAGRS